MKKHTIVKATLAAAPLLLSLSAPAALAGVAGIKDQDAATPGAQFDLYARSGNIVLGDGNSLVAWGYSPSETGVSASGIPAPMQYPGPTLIVKEGDDVTVRLHNGLLVPTSIIFPGQLGVQASACGGSAMGVITLEATRAASLNGNGGCVQYGFKATRPGTFMYQSGTRPELQVEMGLVGALIVRPSDYVDIVDVAGVHEEHPHHTAYGTPLSGPGSVLGYQPTHYDREYLFFLTEMDRSAHEAVDTRQLAFAAGTGTSFDDPALDAVPGAIIDPAGYKATLWFLNGRNGPDTMLERNVDWMPTQPYNALPRAHAGERVLMRLVGAGRDLHPFHHHGNNAWLVARDGQLLDSAPGAAANYPDYNCIPEFDPKYQDHVDGTAADGVTCQGFDATPKVVPGQATLPDESISNYTIQVVPGSTYDAIFTWTGRGLNWDIYGSSAGHQAPLPGASPVITVSNASFESPNVNGESTSDPINWTNSGAGGTNVGTYDPPNSSALQPSDGQNFAWSRRGGVLRQNLTGQTVQPSTRYTLSVDVARGTATFAGYSVALYAGNTLLQSEVNAMTPAASSLQTVTVVYTATGTLPTGTLNIRLASTDPGSASSGNRTYFDNVRLETDVVGSCDESTRLPGEDPGSHCHLFTDAMGPRNFPVTLPEQQSLTFGGFWSGGPYLGSDEPIPPLQGGLNPGAGYSYMWHSHTERELTNDDVFPGGMMTMFILEKEPEVCSDEVHPDNINDDGSFNTTPAVCP